MLARDIAVDYPTVGTGTSALEAVRLLASAERLPGLIVLDENEKPIAVLSDSGVLRLIIPGYLQDNPVLIHVVDEAHADQLCAVLAGKRVGDLLPEKRELLVVKAGDTVMKVAALMAREHTSLVGVVNDEGDLLGAITLSVLFEHALPG